MRIPWRRDDGVSWTLRDELWWMTRKNFWRYRRDKLRMLLHKIRIIRIRVKVEIYQVEKGSQ